MEAAFAPSPWRGLAELPAQEVALRNALARLQEAGPGRPSCQFGGIAFEIRLGDPLARYALRLDFDSAMGRLTVYAECASFHPEYAIETLEALRDNGAELRELLDWGLSSWAESLAQSGWVPLST